MVDGLTLGTGAWRRGAATYIYPSHPLTTGVFHSLKLKIKIMLKLKTLDETSAPVLIRIRIKQTVSFMCDGK